MQFTNAELFDQVVRKPFINATKEECARLWRELCGQVAYNYNDNASTDIPPFAVFAFSAEGRPTARLTTTFLRGNNVRADSDAFGAPSATRQVCYSGLAGTARHDAKTLLQFILQELGDAVRVRAARVVLGLPGLGQFVFDRRTRVYRFTLLKSLPSRIPQYSTFKVPPADAQLTVSQAAAVVRPAPPPTSQTGLQFARTQPLGTLTRASTMTGLSPAGLNTAVVEPPFAATNGRTIRPAVKAPAPFNLDLARTLTTRRPASQAGGPGRCAAPGRTQVPRPKTSCGGTATLRTQPEPLAADAMIGHVLTDEVLAQTERQNTRAGRTASLQAEGPPGDVAVTVTEAEAGTEAGAGAGVEAEAGVAPEPGCTPCAADAPVSAPVPEAPGGPDAPRDPAADDITNRAELFTRTFCKSFQAPVRAHIEYGPIYDRLVGEELERAKQQYIHFRLTGTRPADARAHRFRKMVCITCAMKKDIEAKRLAEARRRAQEKREYTAQALLDAERARREEEDAARARFAAAKAYADANRADADGRDRRARDYRAQGHYHPEGTLMDMPAILDDDMDAPRRRRALAKQYMEEFMDDFRAKQQARRAQRARERAEDAEYADAVTEEEAMRRALEAAAEHAKRRLQRELLDGQARERADPRFAGQRIPGYYDMGNTIPDDDIARRLERSRREAMDVRDSALRDSQLRRARTRAEKAEQDAQDLAAWLDEVDELERRRREQAQADAQTRDALRRSYEDQIRGRRERELRDRLEAARPPSRECFRADEDEPTAPCDDCGRLVKVSGLVVK